MKLRCPVCGAQLERREGFYRCEANHCFDIARQGYLNLLPVQQKHSKNPGDTREQILARRAFLQAGFYAPIAKALCGLAEQYAPAGPILDVGCGEGYYSVQVEKVLRQPLIGLDISREAVRCAAGTYKGPAWICATASHLPVEERTIGTVMSLFALTVPEEFHRVLRPEGLFLQVLAQEDHLLGLKSIIYPQLLHKPKQIIPAVPGFQLLESRPVRFSFTVEGQQVQNLLMMTPHAYRIGPEGAQRLLQTQALTDVASCRINCYRPISSFTFP